mgnify:CR=1 FL=1
MAKKIKNTNETAAENTTEKRTPKKKMLPNVIDHCTKAGKIELQNLLFGTTEKKLLVSNEFLNSMTIKYVSRRMKIINGCFTNIANTKIPARFFRYTNEIESCLEELIPLEPYYMFKDPSPSVYKKNFLLKKPELITKMLSRAWKFVLQKHPLPENIEDIDPKVMDAYDAVINDMLSYEEQLSEDDMALINKFYVQIHGKEIETEIISLTDDEFPDLGIEDMVDENDLSDDEITEAQE